MSLTTAHKDISLLFAEVDEQRYALDVDSAIKALATMKARHMTACWTCFVGKSSVVVIESEYEDSAWKSIWMELRVHYDKINPQRPKTISGIREKYTKIIECYIKKHSRNLGEVSKLTGMYGKIQLPLKWSAYFKPPATVYQERRAADEEHFNALTYEIAGHVENGINFLRVEASEILAFVATDSECIYCPSIPPHLPIAYGLKGSSLPMTVMRAIINDIRDDLKAQNTSVLCEVYDGQFHPIIVKSEDGEPLTCLQHSIQHFRSTMNESDRSALLHELLKYSDVVNDDLKYISGMQFKAGLKKDLDSVRISMKKKVQGKITVKQLYIETLDYNGFQMKHIVTSHRKEIWQKYMRQKVIEKPHYECQKLTTSELKEMVEGTRLHRRILAHMDGEVSSEISDSMSDINDADYVPEDESEITDIDDFDCDQDMSIEPNISTLSTTSEGNSCIQQIIQKLQQIENRHNWKNESVDTFVRKYLTSKRNMRKLFKYEMDVIHAEILRVFGKSIFNRNDPKDIRVQKLYIHLRQMPEMVFVESTDDENQHKYQPLKLAQIYRNFVTSSKYPKEYLAAAVCKIHHRQKVAEWEAKSHIPINVNLPFIDDTHIIFNYPEFSPIREQVEMRTFDYSHILNNLRFHICNRGFTGVKTEAFVHVSKVNHDVLPLAIVEDKLDRQNSDITEIFL